VTRTPAALALALVVASTAAAAEPAGAPAPAPLFRVRQGGLWGYIDAAGRLAIPPRFDRAEPFSEGLAAVELDGRHGWIDRTGALVLAPPFLPAGTLHRPFSGGLAAVRVGQRYGYVDRAGALAIPARYTTAEDFSEGLAMVCDPDACGYVDRTGRGVLGPGFMGGQPVREGLAVAVLAMSMGRQRVALYDVGGGRLGADFEGAGARSGGLVPVRTGGRWGYLDAAGRVAIPARFAWAGDFAGGLAPAAAEAGRCGYVDRTGAFAIAPRFRACRPFSGARALVDLAGEHQAARPAFIDRAGAVVVAGDAGAVRFDAAEDFHDGLAAVGVGGEPSLAGDGTRLGYVDEAGRWVWKPTE
jgi:hypothetical protein